MVRKKVTNATDIHSIMDSLRELDRRENEFHTKIGKDVHVWRNSKHAGGIESYVNVYGRLIDVTQSFIVIERTDIVTGDYKQIITFTFADFFLGTYSIEYGHILN